MSTGGARVGGAGGAVSARRDAGRRGFWVRGSAAIQHSAPLTNHARPAPPLAMRSIAGGGWEGGFAGGESAPIPPPPRAGEGDRRGASQVVGNARRQARYAATWAPPLAMRSIAGGGWEGVLCRWRKRPHPSLPPRAGEGDRRGASQVGATRGKETSAVLVQARAFAVAWRRHVYPHTQALGRGQRSAR